MLRFLVLALALASAALAQSCSYTINSYSVSKGGPVANISCTVSQGQYLAPRYSGIPMVRSISGSNFSIAIFNETNYENYNDGFSATCLNGQSCTRRYAEYNIPLSWPYADTFYFVPICPDNTPPCVIDVNIRMDSPTPTSNETPPPTTPAPTPTSSGHISLPSFVVVCAPIMISLMLCKA